MMFAASYCRVSTDKEDQVNSFESQQRYFRTYIENHSDWILYRIYADEGISGTTTRKRTQFNQMMEDARAGKFKIILTKEVSRFSRNILDTIHYTRELRSLGIGVIFMTDGINTLDTDSELRLSIMGSIAQEESRRTSARVKWGQTRKMEQGTVFGPSMLGYDVKNGCLTVNMDGAEIVREIFYKYGIEKKGTTQIARELQQEGLRTFAGNRNWNPGQIVKILKNEKYVGDLIQKKTITPDYLTHHRQNNHGEEELVILQNHHEPIISRELWETVQKEIKNRNRHSPGTCCHSVSYALSGKIKCGICGGNFVMRKREKKDGSVCRYWKCYATVKYGADMNSEIKRCINRCIREDSANEVIKQVISDLQIDVPQILNNVLHIAACSFRKERGNMHCSLDMLAAEAEHIKEKTADSIEAYLNHVITQEELKQIKKRYAQKMVELRKKMLEAEKDADTQISDKTKLENMKTWVRSLITGDNAMDLFFKIVLDKLIVYPDGTVEVYLNNLPAKWTFLIQ